MRKKGCCFAGNREEIATLLTQARSKGHSSEEQWQKAGVFSNLLKSGVSASRIARKTGHSVTMVLEYANAFNTFQNSAQKNLTFTHYRYAAKTADPVRWIKIAAEKNLTSRQLEREIKKAQKQKTAGKWTAAQARKNADQYARILDALAQQLGIDGWDGEPTAHFANELISRVTQLVKKCEAAVKVNAAVFKMLSRTAV